MHTFFNITLFTGQQLVLEGLQQWLARPCPDAAAQHRRRLGIKQLVSLLLRTAATGVLATVLDAAIEFRRRQLLAVAAADAAAEESGSGGMSGRLSSLPGLGMLSRAGVAAWKSRLLLAIDELERRAGAYGIESRHRFSPGKDECEGHSNEGGSHKQLAAPLHAASSCLDLAGSGSSEEERSQRLGRTVDQLRELVKHGDAGEPQRRADVDDEVASRLVDLILGASTPPSSPHTPTASAAATAPAAAAHSRSRSVPAQLDCMWPAEQEERNHQAGSSSSSSAHAVPAELCAICMDRHVTVQVGTHAVGRVLYAAV